MSGFSGFDGLKQVQDLAKNFREPNGLYDVSKLVGIKNAPEDSPDKPVSSVNKDMTFKDLMKLLGLTGNEKNDNEAYKKVSDWLAKHPDYKPGNLTKDWLNNNKPSSTVMKTEDMKKLGDENPQTKYLKTKYGDTEENKIISALKSKYPEIYKEILKGI